MFREFVFPMTMNLKNAFEFFLKRLDTNFLIILVSKIWIGAVAHFFEKLLKK